MCSDVSSVVSSRTGFCSSLVLSICVAVMVGNSGEKVD